MYGKGEEMNDISIASLVLFIASGILFTIAIVVFVKAFYSKQSSSETSNKRLTMLNEVILVHTNEKIEYQPQITDMRSE